MRTDVSAGVNENVAGSREAQTSFGPIARTVTDQAHVYTTVVTGVRWLAVVTGAAGVAITTWICHDTLRGEAAADPWSWAFGAAFGLLGLAMLALSFLVLYARARLSISAAGLVLRRRGLLFGGRRSHTWRLDQLDSVGVGTMPTFHIGGSTPQFHLVLGFTDGDSERFGGAFDDVPSTERAARAIVESARRFQAPG